MGWRKPYDRWTVEELEAIRPEVKEAIVKASQHYQGDRSGVQGIANKYNLEQGLLLVLGSELWDLGFRDAYEKNTDTKLYLKWAEYRDVHT